MPDPGFLFESLIPIWEHEVNLAGAEKKRDVRS